MTNEQKPIRVEIILPCFNPYSEGDVCNKNAVCHRGFGYFSCATFDCVSNGKILAELITDPVSLVEIDKFKLQQIIDRKGWDMSKTTIEHLIQIICNGNVIKRKEQK